MVRTAPERRLAFAVTSTLGVNRLLAPHLPGLKEDGWHIDVICAPGPLDQGVVEFADVSPIRMERSIRPMADSIALARMTSTLRRLRPDVLVGGTPKAGMLSMVAGRMARVPVRVFQVRGARWDGMHGRSRILVLGADRVAAANATDVVAVSDSLARLMVDSGATRRRPVVLGAGGSKGVDTSLFRPGPDQVLDSRAPRLIFIGRLVTDKGVDEAVGVFNEVRRARPGATLRVIGDLDDTQPVSAATLAVIRDDPGVCWERDLSAAEIALRLQRSDVMLFPSVREGLPNVVIEAASCGVPVVGWRATGVVDAVVAGRTGFLVPVGDTQALVSATQEALDPETHASMRSAAADFARESFDADVVLANFREYLNQLVA